MSQVISWKRQRWRSSVSPGKASMMTSRQSLAVKMPVCSPSCTRIDLVLCVRMASAASSKVASPGRQTGSRTQASRTVAVSSVCNSRLPPRCASAENFCETLWKKNAANRLLDSMSCMTTALGMAYSSVSSCATMRWLPLPLIRARESNVSSLRKTAVISSWSASSQASPLMTTYSCSTGWPGLMMASPTLK